MDQTRDIDVVWAPLLIGLAGALLVVAFQKKIEAIRDRSPLKVAAPAVVLIMAALGLIRSKVVDVSIPIPVPRLAPMTAGYGLKILAASLLASLMVLAAIIGPFSSVNKVNLRLPREIAGDYFVWMILILDMVAVDSRSLYVNPSPYWLFLAIALAAILCRASDKGLAGVYSRRDFEREWLELHAADRMPVRYRGFYLVTAVRVLTLTAIWSLMIIQLLE